MPYIITKNVNLKIPKGEYQSIRSIARKAEVSLDGWSDWLIEAAVPGYSSMMKQLAPAVEMGCLNQANASSKVMAIDENIKDISTSWKPSGFYSPEQIVLIVNMVLPVLITAKAQVETAPNSTSDATTVKNISIKDLQRKIDEATVYTKGANDALGASIQIVESQGLRRWVLFALTTVSQAYVTVATLRCHTTYLDTLNSIVQSIGSFLKKLVQVAVNIGQAILKIPDAVSTVWTIAKYAAIAGAGYYVYREYIKK